jgi:uncharacterized membrane protein HdeD (DUF308 family)
LSRPAEDLGDQAWQKEGSTVLLGILAIARAVAATVVSMLFFGWLLVIAAGIELVQAIMVGKWVGRYHHWVAARDPSQPIGV